jgi:hypothetical protein
MSLPRRRRPPQLERRQRSGPSRRPGPEAARGAPSCTHRAGSSSRGRPGTGCRSRRDDRSAAAAPNEPRPERDLCHMNGDRLVVCSFGLPALRSTPIEPPGDECSTGGIRASIVLGYQHVRTHRAQRAHRHRLSWHLPIDRYPARPGPPEPLAVPASLTAHRPGRRARGPRQRDPRPMPCPAGPAPEAWPRCP